MKEILIISRGEKSTAFFEECIKEAFDDSENMNISSLLEAKNAKNNEYDLLITTEYKEIENAIEKYKSFIIIFIAEKDYDNLKIKELEESGVIVLERPVNRRLFISALRIARVAFDKISAYILENNKLAKKLEDIKIINRAKLILVANLSMSESEAHRFIEKQAMDSQNNRREIAERILKTYERE